MKQKKMRFFKRIKNAIVNFDEYKNFAEEKLWTTIKYILKLTLIFTIIVSLAVYYKVGQEMDKALQIYKNECPEFRIENNTLIIDNQNKQFAKGDSNGYFGILINSEKEDINEIQEATNYPIIIAGLKDKIVIRSYDGLESVITYEELSKSYDVSKFNKQGILEFITGNETMQLYTIIIVVSIAYLYIAYLIQFILDIIILSVIAYLLIKMIEVKIKYKSIFNMSAYAITLSVILYMIYACVNMLTGFTIKYFEIAYNLIAYIYIITAMLIIKSDLIKQQIEVEKIVEEQKKVREEKQKEEKKEEDKEKNDTEKKEKDRENSKEEGQPEGNEA